MGKMAKTNVTQWFVFFKDKLLLKKEYTEKGEIKYSIPISSEPPLQPEAEKNIHEVVSPNGKRVQTFAVKEPIVETEKWMMTRLRASYDHITKDEYRSAGKAYQILYWDEHSHFCPVCGTSMEKQSPIMKKCPDCGNEMYPPVSTAVIVLIRKGKEILLVRARNFQGTFYGLVAGFLEAGETLEECVEREVLEETGLRVKNIRYFGNQSWPYPSGLMVGFIADYESGNIKLQEDELSAAAFFSKDSLPEIPRKPSIARKLIDWWLNEKRQ
ncbi:NAD(+) diphosphatase [Bacteroides sp. KG68]|uniref:NAD(+) diphosphatase n=1 Tax=unclassified Bacteroides TaxID=2646097 RepID=UPI003D99B6F9